MARMNEHFLQLEQSYLFTRIAQKVNAFAAANPDRTIIRMGIGDVTLPLAPAVIQALQEGAVEMSARETFRGYGPEQGYAFLREAVAGYYHREMGVEIAPDEILISDGAKSDVGNIVDLFDAQNTVLISDPVYPVYRDTNLMSGRQVVLVQASSENGFLPLPDPSIRADLIYICSPNNPTGAVYTRNQLQQWVDYAREAGAIILFDAAYERFVQDPQLPRSIFQIPGARSCAIEFCSLSKTAGFTGLRCGYTVVPKELCARTAQGEEIPLLPLWVRRQTTKFNGVPYVVQKAAAAVFSPQGLAQCDQNLAYYRQNARIIQQLMEEKGVEYYGGLHSPYIWFRCPGGMNSWDFFDRLLEEQAVVGTPGSGFGAAGEGFFRLTAFGTQEGTQEAMARMRGML